MVLGSSEGLRVDLMAKLEQKIVASLTNCLVKKMADAFFLNKKKRKEKSRASKKRKRKKKKKCNKI